MSEVERWTELWLLNGLILEELPLDNLVQIEHEWVWWDFPEVHVRESDEKMRLHLVDQLASKKWVQVLKTKKGMFVEILEQGFLYWERIFNPNWSRYWEYRELECTESGTPTKIELVFIDQRFLKELEEHLPAMFFLDADFGLNELSSGVKRNFSIGRWKIIETAFFSIRSVRSLALSAQFRDSRALQIWKRKNRAASLRLRHLSDGLNLTALLDGRMPPTN